MPEDVEVEETSARHPWIAGVPTSTLGMVGVTEYGPVPHPSRDGQGDAGPRLVTSAAEYERFYGGVMIRALPCRLALAARAFFANGGQRLYVQRVFVPTAVEEGTGPEDDFAGIELPVGAKHPVVNWGAHWPGAAGSRIRVVTRFRRSENIQVGGELRGVRPGAAVETAGLVAGRPPVIADDEAPANLHLVTQVDGVLGLREGVGGFTVPVTDEAAFHITLDVEVDFGDRVDTYRQLELGAEHPRYIASVLHATEPTDETCLVWLADGAPGEAGSAGSPGAAAAVLAALVSPGKLGIQLVGGSDGDELTPAALQGRASPADTSAPATGLAALAEVDDIAIVAMPDSTYFQDETRAAEAVDALIAHCEGARFRFALIDPPESSALAQVRAFRSRFDSPYAALYHPWLRVRNPAPGPHPGLPTVDVPPSGAVAGILARSDSERGVHEAPANQPLLGITGIVAPLSAGEQEVLSAESVNTLRDLAEHGNVVWGARTISSDPAWRYVTVRRLVIYLEHSIAKSTQWAVFEPNDERLWETIRGAVGTFLTSTWRAGALMGATPEEAFFVRCDRTTMTQNDLDNGRLVCEVAVAPVRPAEFVIFRIGHWTADARAD